MTQFIKDIGPTLTGLMGSMVAVIALVVGYLTNRALYTLQRSKEERDEIYKKLNSFYGPFLQLRSESLLLYKKFAVAHKEADPHFRTLTYLLAGGIFSGNDAVLLRQILTINNQLQLLLLAQGGLIDRSDVREELGSLGMHIRVLSLACDGELSGAAVLFEDSTFPRNLDEILSVEVNRLKGRLNELNATGSIIKFFQKLSYG